MPPRLKTLLSTTHNAQLAAALQIMDSEGRSRLGSLQEQQQEEVRTAEERRRGKRNDGRAGSAAGGRSEMDEHAGDNEGKDEDEGYGQGEVDEEDGESDSDGSDGSADEVDTSDGSSDDDDEDDDEYMSLYNRGSVYKRGREAIHLRGRGTVQLISYLVSLI